MSGSLIRGALRSVVMLYVAFVLVHAPAARAQTPPAPDPTQAAIDSLSPTSQAVISRLSALSDLPAGEWRFHAGDLAHAESPDIDDSRWELRKGESVAPPESVWFRRWVEVPKTLNGYDLTGSQIWFQFQADVNGPMTTIIYVDGRRVAMGEELEPIVLFENCKPGDKVLLAVKLLQTVDQKRVHPEIIRIFQPSSRPSPSDMREEFVSAALLIPSLAADPAAEKAILEKAMGAVDLAALGASNQSSFDASLRKSRDLLQPIQPSLRRATYHLTGNSHIDAAWIWPWTETVDSVRHTWGTALQLMNEYPMYTFTQSAAQYNVWMAEKYPQINDAIKQRIQEGRWEIVGGMWIEPDLNMPDGESLVRQILIGKRTYKQLYGVDVRIGWNPDSFGYNWQLPQIYKRAGIDYFVTQKMVWNDTNQLPLKLFWWESPDGSKVLTYFPHGYDNADFNPSRLAADMMTARERAAGLPEMMDLYGVGDHGGGATREVLDDGVHWSAADKITPKMQFGLAQTFFNDVEGKLDSDSPTWNYAVLAAGKEHLGATSNDRIRIPTWNDELYFEYHRGVQTTQANHKRNMRESEEWMLNAEKYASLAWLNGSAYPHAELNDAWKKVLFNQFHDLAAGSGIGVIYKDAQNDYDEIRRSTNEVSAAALHTLQAEIDTHGDAGVPVVIFNPLAWNRSGIVSVEVEMPAAIPQNVYVLDAHQRVLPSLRVGQDTRTNTVRLLVQARDVPSFGYQVVRVVPGKQDAQTDLKANGLELENSFLKVAVNAHTGCITSLYDKKSQFETLTSGGCGNELIAFKDIPKDYDAWNIDSNFDQVFTRLEQADSVELVESNSLRAVIRVSRHWQASKFVQDIVLYNGSDQVEVVNDIDWHEEHILLKAAFPLAASGKQATYEIPYGSIQRPTTRDNSWESAKFEVPALRWADAGNEAHGFSLINESKYGYDDKGNVLRLSLLRSPTWPDPDADRGHHHFSYALYPHAGTWKQALTVRHGYEFNYKLQATQVESHAGVLPSEHSFIQVDAQNVVLTALKKSEDSDGLILRFYEWAGQNGKVKLSVPEGVVSATATNLMEQPEGAPLAVVAGESSLQAIQLPVHPYEIISVRLDYKHPAQ